MRHNFFVTITLAFIVLFVVTATVAKADDGHDLDETFGQHGIFKISIARKEIFVIDAVAQSDGKIVVAMKVSDKTDTGSTALVRLNEDGSLDEKFGISGIVSIAHSQPKKIALLPNGKVVVVGARYTYSTMNVVVSLVNSSGIIDSHFSDHGTLRDISKYWSEINAIAVQSDGKIIIGGSISIPESLLEDGSIKSYARPHFLLARIGSEGMIDSTFGQSGIVAIKVGSAARVIAISCQQDGRIIAAGVSYHDGKGQMVISRYSDSGYMDNTFGNDGMQLLQTEIPPYASPKAMFLADGRMLTSFKSKTNLLISNFFIGDDIKNSIVNTDNLNIDINPFVGWVGPILTKDKKIIVAGSITRQPPPGKSQPPYYYKTAVVRFFASGQRDSSFGSDGVNEFTIGAVADYISLILSQGNGRTILIGTSKDQDVTNLFVLGLKHH